MKKKSSRLEFRPVVEYNGKKYTVMYETIIVEIIENAGILNYVEEMDDDVISAVENIIYYGMNIDECFKVKS